MTIPLITASARIKNGRLYFHDRRRFDELVASMRDGWEVEVDVIRLRATRSMKQNAYYFGVVLAMLSDYTGQSVDTLHELLKVKFLSRTEIVSDKQGDIVESFILGRSTRALKTHEFARYVDDVRQWAAEKLDLVIPDPDPSWRGRTEPQDECEEAGYGAGV